MRLLLLSLVLGASARLEVPARRAFSQGHKSLAARSARGGAEVRSKVPVKGIVVVSSGMLCHMVSVVFHETLLDKGVTRSQVLGTLYLWGNLISYAPPSLLFFSGKSESGQPDALGVIPLTIVFQMIAMPLGAEMAKQVGTRITSLVSGALIAFGVYASSYANSLQTFMLFYAALFGFGVGLGYTAPMIAGWTFFPKSRGLVNGLILLGFGAGGFFANILSSHLANPGGTMMINPATGRFPQEVYNNFPKMLRKLALLYASASLIGGLQITTKKIEGAISPENIKTKVSKKNTKKIVVPPETRSIPLSQAPKTPTFWALYCIIILTATSGLTSASIYKLYAAASPAVAKAGDLFLANTGALGALFNGAGRLACAAAVDSFGYKIPFLLLLLCQTLNSALYPLAAQTSPTAFLASTCISFFLMGGVFSTSPTAAALAFGPESAPLIYGLLFSAFGFASTGGVKLAKKLIPALGWTSLYHVLALTTLAAAPLLTVLNLSSS